MPIFKRFDPEQEGKPHSNGFLTGLVIGVLLYIFLSRIQRLTFLFFVRRNRHLTKGSKVPRTISRKKSAGLNESSMAIPLLLFRKGNRFVSALLGSIPPKRLNRTVKQSLSEQKRLNIQRTELPRLIISFSYDQTAISETDTAAVFRWFT